MTIIKAERTYTVINLKNKQTNKETVWQLENDILNYFNASYSFVALERHNLVQVFLCHDFFGKSQGLLGDLLRDNNLLKLRTGYCFRVRKQQPQL